MKILLNSFKIKFKNSVSQSHKPYFKHATATSWLMATVLNGTDLEHFVHQRKFYCREPDSLEKGPGG